MNAILTACVCFLTLVQANGQGLSRDALRRALNQNPLFSHGREVIVPQNVDIKLPINEHPTNRLPTIVQQELAVKQNQHIQPVSVPAASVPATSVPAASVPAASVPAASVISQMRPQTAVDQQTSKNPLVQETIRKPILKPQTINDRMADNIAVTKTRSPTTNRQKSKCGFKMPAVVMPDLNIAQTDFEQQFLLPALIARLQNGGVCNTRGLTIYIDWLLHLRQKLFNV